MRKIKKINGFLVVRYNDREKREYAGTTLGEYGVIDAELYTGCLDLDRSVMEYDDAGTLEEAVELARGLESEEDIREDEPTYIIVKETDETTTEEPVVPQLMISGWEAKLSQQVEDHSQPDLCPRTAAHELYGFKTALHQLGMLEEEECAVRPDTFGPAFDNSIPGTLDELYAFACDDLCGLRQSVEHDTSLDNDERQERLDRLCEGCKLEQFAREGETQKKLLRSMAEEQLAQLRQRLLEDDSKERFEQDAAMVGGFLQGLTLGGIFPDKNAAISQAEIAAIRKDRAELFTAFTKPNGYFVPWPDKEERVTFEHLPPSAGGGTAQKIYSLGCSLSVDCPGNDCRVYLNSFNMCREMDEQIDRVEGWPREVLTMELRRRYHELETMYQMNYAVRCYRSSLRNEKKKEPPVKGTTPIDTEYRADLEEHLRDNKQLERELIQAHEKVSHELRQLLGNNPPAPVVLGRTSIIRRRG